MKELVKLSELLYNESGNFLKTDNYNILRGGNKMAVISELLKAEANGTLSFGDYTLDSKTKLDGFEFQGDIYKVKTFNEITKLEKNGIFVYESVPGTAVWNYEVTGEGISFEVYGTAAAQFTVGLEPESKYEVYLDDVSVGKMTTNLSGKLSVSAELNERKSVEVKIVKR